MDEAIVEKIRQNGLDEYISDLDCLNDLVRANHF